MFLLLILFVLFVIRCATFRAEISCAVFSYWQCRLGFRCPFRRYVAPFLIGRGGNYFSKFARVIIMLHFSEFPSIMNHFVGNHLQLARLQTNVYY